MGDKYDAERYDPALAHCSKLELVFDGTTLTMTGGTVVHTYPAVSGKPDEKGKFDYSPERQKKGGTGPIPEGTYWVNPAEIWTLRFYHSKAAAEGWGEYRLTIHPFETTVTHGRGGFFIHGGKYAGSAGCIDLTSKISSFVEDLGKEGARRKCQIHVKVKYPTP